MKARERYLEHNQKATLPNGKQIVFRHAYHICTMLVYEGSKLIKVRSKLYQ